MKYLILLGDGMADFKNPELDGKTPLQFARTPHMDLLASKGVIGTASTVPPGYPPGSDVANLSVMGYDPAEYYTGRSPLEAVSMGVELAPDDVAFRCNLVTLSDSGKYPEKTMVDYSADEVTTPESGELIKKINGTLGTKDIIFHPGFRFRHLLVWKGGPEGVELTPPHDISGRVIAEYLPEGEGGATLLKLMEESYNILSDHPVNVKRIEQGLRPANSVWFWGKGKKPSLTSFHEKYGLRGSVISAVDLIKGIGICAGLDIVEVDNVTGTVETNASGKVAAAVNELSKGKDFVYLHVEAPDAASHRGETETKIKAIEMVDDMLGRLLEGMEQFDSYKVMVLPDHPTPLSTMTHTDKPVPFVIYTSGQDSNNVNGVYNEAAAEKSGLSFAAGHKLMDYFIRGE
ncbi:cofactor-independent phosphoglycerate mutase [Pelotomaculum propionicicum]|uniref:cofactor-independent phosphoglycerate mutase n=1 Tax=Pelotomaculum propionicicum TaxID=258475 RepID=UPI003B7811EA